MAIVRASEIRGNSLDNLESKLNELRLELSKERSAAKAGVPKNPGRIRELRKSVARILTVINSGDFNKKSSGSKTKKKPKKEKTKQENKESKKETKEKTENKPKDKKESKDSKKEEKVEIVDTKVDEKESEDKK